MVGRWFGTNWQRGLTSRFRQASTVAASTELVHCQGVEIGGRGAGPGRGGGVLCGEA